MKNENVVERSFSISIAAKMLGIHPATLRIWDADGKIRSFRTPGNHRRIRMSEIERLRQCRDNPSEEAK